MCTDIYSSEFKNKFINPVLNALENSPNTVSLEVTTRCQLDCIYCNRDKNTLEDLDLRNVTNILEHLSGVENIVICGMGESFCYPYLYELLGMLSHYNISITTNGSIKIDFNRLVRYSNVKLLVFSIDATKSSELGKICRGYQYDILIQNLRNLKSSSEIIGVINATLVNDNICEITNIVRFANKNGLQAVNFGLPIGNQEFVERNRKEIRKNIRLGMEEAKRVGVIFNPFYRISCHTRKRIQPVITIGGDFFACCNLINHNDAIGNIFESDICDIWEKAKEKIKKNSECCSCELVKNMWKVMG